MILHDLPTTKKLSKNSEKWGSPFTNHSEYLVKNNIVATYSRDASGAQALAQRCVLCRVGNLAQLQCKHLSF